MVAKRKMFKHILAVVFFATLFSFGHADSVEAVNYGAGTYNTGLYSATTPDSTGPVISLIASGSISQTGATITWTTDEASDSQVEYGLTTSYGTSTTLDSSLVTSHSVLLTGLSAGQTYHYRVISKDALANSTTSGDQSFVTISQTRNTAYGNSAPYVVPLSTVGCTTTTLYSPTTGARCPSTPSTVPTPTIPVMPPFTVTLWFGVRNAEVLRVQHYLNTHGYPVAPSGPGSLGNETTLFGRATKAALIKFQIAHGILPATGTFGPKTKAFINTTPTY